MKSKIISADFLKFKSVSFLLPNDMKLGIFMKNIGKLIIPKKSLLLPIFTYDFNILYFVLIG